MQFHCVRYLRVVVLPMVLPSLTYCIESGLASCLFFKLLCHCHTMASCSLHAGTHWLHSGCICIQGSKNTLSCNAAVKLTI